MPVNKNPQDTAKKQRDPQPLHVAQIADALLKIQTVSAVTGLSGPTIYRRLRAGQFPEPVRLGARCTRWRAGDVQAWAASVALA